MTTSSCKSNHHLVPQCRLIAGVMAAAALLFLFGCSPDKDVTADPHYNFSSFGGTVWKTKTRSAIAGIKGYSGGPKFVLLPPESFDPTETNYWKSPDLDLITALPSGVCVHITRLLQGQGLNGGGYGVEANVDNGTNASKTVYLDRDFLTNVWWAAKSPTTNTNWGVNPDLLAPAGDSRLSASASPEIGDTSEAGYKKGYANGQANAIMANNALPQNKQAAIKGLSDPWLLDLKSRPVAVKIYGEDYVNEYESGYRKGFHDHSERK